MSFGNLNLILERTIEILKPYNLKKVSLTKLSYYKTKVYNDLQKGFNKDITIDIVDEIFSRLFISNYKFTDKISFNNGKNSFREFEDKYPDIKIPSKYKKLFDHYEKLKNLPQPEQRSPEWYAYRYNRITASDTAAAIDLNPYEPLESFILKKCDPNFPFRDNATVFHGRKYEPTATMIYEHIYNTRVVEFGALPSEQYSFLGASPDGICSQHTLDNKFSDRLGTMLEIKCPVTREIYTKGKIIGTICPFYYYCQVQQQLACCDLNVCDFWQCKFSEYKSREEYLSDDCSSCVNTTDDTGIKMEIDNRLKKGIILEFYPKNFKPEFEGDLPEWKSQYIIPKRLDIDESQYDKWTNKMLDQYKTLYPEIAKDYYFYQIIYWKLDSSHNVAIKRDDKFLSNIIPILQENWEKILYYRKNQDKLEELKKIAEKRKKYIRFNTNYTIYSKQITDGKIDILDKSCDLKKLIGTNTKPYNKIKPIENNNCDFIEDDDIIPIKQSNAIKQDTSKGTKYENISVLKTSSNNDCDFIDD